MARKGDFVFTYQAIKLPGKDVDNLKPGQWTYWEWLGYEDSLIVAVSACPDCGKVSTFSPAKHRIDSDGTAHPSYVCPYKPCKFHRFVRLKDWNPQKFKAERDLK